MTLKRYLLFTFDSYYPSGGWHDLAGNYDTVTEAWANRGGQDNYQIVDSANGNIVEEG